MFTRPRLSAAAGSDGAGETTRRADPLCCRARLSASAKRASPSQCCSTLLAEAEAGAAQGGGIILPQRRWEGQHGGFLAFVTQTRLASEGAPAERFPFPELGLVARTVESESSAP